MHLTEDAREGAEEAVVVGPREVVRPPGGEALGLGDGRVGEGHLEGVGCRGPERVAGVDEVHGGAVLVAGSARGGVAVGAREVALQVGRAQGRGDRDAERRQPGVGEGRLEAAADLVEALPEDRPHERLRVFEDADDVELVVDQRHEAARPQVGRQLGLGVERRHPERVGAVEVLGVGRRGGAAEPVLLTGGRLAELLEPAAQPGHVRRQRVDRGRHPGRGGRRGGRRLQLPVQRPPEAQTQHEGGECEGSLLHRTLSITPHPITSPAAPSGVAASSRRDRITSARLTGEVVPLSDKTASMRS